MSVVANSRQEVGEHVALSVHADEPVHRCALLLRTGWPKEGCDIWTSSFGFCPPPFWRYAMPILASCFLLLVD